jgi:peroxiredoxin
MFDGLKTMARVSRSMSKLFTPGDPAPDFMLEDVQGKRTRLSDFRGRPVILAFLRGFQ